MSNIKLSSITSLVSSDSKKVDLVRELLPSLTKISIEDVLETLISISSDSCKVDLLKLLQSKLDGIGYYMLDIISLIRSDSNKVESIKILWNKKNMKYSQQDLVKITKETILVIKNDSSKKDAVAHITETHDLSIFLEDLAELISSVKSDSHKIGIIEYFVGNINITSNSNYDSIIQQISSNNHRKNACELLGVTQVFDKPQPELSKLSHISNCSASTFTINYGNKKRLLGPSVITNDEDTINFSVTENGIEIRDQESDKKDRVGLESFHDAERLKTGDCEDLGSSNCFSGSLIYNGVSFCPTNRGWKGVDVDANVYVLKIGKSYKIKDGIIMNNDGTKIEENNNNNNKPKLKEITEKDIEECKKEKTKNEANSYSLDLAHECECCHAVKPNVMISPCGHSAICAHCAHEERKRTGICPFCRTKIDNIFKRF